MEIERKERSSDGVITVMFLLKKSRRRRESVGSTKDHKKDHRSSSAVSSGSELIRDRQSDITERIDLTYDRECVRASGSCRSSSTCCSSVEKRLLKSWSTNISVFISTEWMIRRWMRGFASFTMPVSDWWRSVCLSLMRWTQNVIRFSSCS